MDGDGAWVFLSGEPPPEQLLVFKELFLQCSYCGEIFTLLYTLSVHLMMHTRQQPVDCDLEDNGFGEHSTLKVHQRINTDEKPSAVTSATRALVRAPICIDTSRHTPARTPTSVTIATRASVTDPILMCTGGDTDTLAGDTAVTTVL
jgi:hypothetical protein